MAVDEEPELLAQALEIARRDQPGEWEEVSETVMRQIGRAHI